MTPESTSLATEIHTWIFIPLTSWVHMKVPAASQTVQVWVFSVASVLSPSCALTSSVLTDSWIKSLTFSDSFSLETSLSFLFLFLPLSLIPRFCIFLFDQRTWVSPSFLSCYHCPYDYINSNLLADLSASKLALVVLLELTSQNACNAACCTTSYNSCSINTTLLLPQLQWLYLLVELTHWKRLWSWDGLGAGGEGDDREWDGWMASPTRWTWVWVNSGSWWWTGSPGVLQFMESRRVGHNWVTELNWDNSTIWLSPPHAKSWIIGKDPDAGRNWRREEKGTTEDEMAGWHHRLNGHEFG